MKLTPAQWRMLDRICRTNGGGVHAGFNESARETKVIFKLHEMGLVQGKESRLDYAVHTREGLELWRASLAKEKEAAQ